MVYCSWDMVSDRCNCYFSLCYFLPFYPPLPPPLTAQKMKISKQWKKCPEISSFYKSLPKIITICSTLPEIGHMTHTSSPLTAKKKKKKIEKMKKTPGHIIILKLWLNNGHFLRYGAWQTDRQMVGKSEIDPPKNRNRQF